MGPTMRIDPKSVFLLDGIGALLTALSLGVILPLVPEWIGLAPSVLRALGGVGAIYAAYSLSRYFVGETTRGLWLRALMVANLAYCVLTATLVGLHFGSLEVLGVVYFGGEILIILALVALELRVYRRAFPS